MTDVTGVAIRSPKAPLGQQGEHRAANGRPYLHLIGFWNDRGHDRRKISQTNTLVRAAWKHRVYLFRHSIPTEKKPPDRQAPAGGSARGRRIARIGINTNFSSEILVRLPIDGAGRASPAHPDLQDNVRVPSNPECSRKPTIGTIFSSHTESGGLSAR